MPTQKPYDCYNTQRKQKSRAYTKDGKQRIETTTEITRDCAVVTTTNEEQETSEDSPEHENRKAEETENEKLFSKLVEHFTK